MSGVEASMHSFIIVLLGQFVCKGWLALEKYFIENTACLAGVCLSSLRV